MKVILISGKARFGKDLTANLIKEQLELKDKKVLVTHYADLLKYICKTFFEWNGVKDSVGRTILQFVGTDTIRGIKPDFWVDFIISILTMFDDSWDYILIPDTRFPNEIVKMKSSGLNCIAVRINRPNFVSSLTNEQLNHISETALDDYRFDYIIENDSSLDGLKREVDKLIDIL